MNLDKIKEIFSIEGRTKYFVSVFVFLSIASIVVFILLVVGNKSLANKKEALQKTERINPFENINIEARSAMVFDVINNRELFSKNPDLPMPLASITKVLTALLTEENLDRNLEIEITLKNLEPEGDSKLIVGDIWKLNDLRDFTLLTSSNDGAAALAAIIEEKNADKQTDEDNGKARFIKAMNDIALAIGLSNSRFFNEHGLDRPADNRGGSYGSARDVVYLFGYIINNYPNLLEATRYKSLTFKSAQGEYVVDNTNILVNKIPNLIASKTGYTDLAGGNLVIVFDGGLNRPIIISVLGSSQEGRFEDTVKLVDATMEHISGF